MTYTLSKNLRYETEVNGTMLNIYKVTIAKKKENKQLIFSCVGSSNEVMVAHEAKKNGNKVSVLDSLIIKVKDQFNKYYVILTETGLKIRKSPLAAVNVSLCKNKYRKEIIRKL